MALAHQEWINFIFWENTHNIRNFLIISNENKKILSYGKKTIKFRTPSVRANLPEEYKLANSLNIFKRKIKNWKCKTWSCRICQTFQKKIAFISNFIICCSCCCCCCCCCFLSFLYCGEYR